jgi:hypothetical protein
MPTALKEKYSLKSISYNESIGKFYRNTCRYEKKKIKVRKRLILA